jgi:hypothetical protein
VQTKVVSEDLKETDDYVLLLLSNSPTKYTYNSLFTIPLYIIIICYMFRPYISHNQAETVTRDVYDTCISHHNRQLMHVIKIQYIYKRCVQLGCTNL